MKADKKQAAWMYDLRVRQRLLASGAQGGSVGELGEIARMFAGITDEHAQRMAALGLANWGGAPTRD